MKNRKKYECQATPCTYLFFLFHLLSPGAGFVLARRQLEAAALRVNASHSSDSINGISPYLRRPSRLFAFFHSLVYPQKKREYATKQRLPPPLPSRSCDTVAQGPMPRADKKRRERGRTTKITPALYTTPRASVAFFTFFFLLTPFVLGFTALSMLFIKREEEWRETSHLRLYLYCLTLYS